MAKKWGVLEDGSRRVRGSWGFLCGPFFGQTYVGVLLKGSVSAPRTAGVAIIAPIGKAIVRDRLLESTNDDSYHVAQKTRWCDRRAHESEACAQHAQSSGSPSLSTLQSMV